MEKRSGKVGEESFTLYGQFYVVFKKYNNVELKELVYEHHNKCMNLNKEASEAGESDGYDIGSIK